MIQTKNVSPAQKTTWAENWAKKDSSYYDSLKEKYVEIIKRKELLTILEALDAVKTRLSLPVDNQCRKSDTYWGKQRNNGRGVEVPQNWTKYFGKED